MKKRTAAVCVMLLLGLLGVSSSAYATTLPSTTITPQQPNDVKTTPFGTFNEQVNFGASGGARYQWSFEFNSTYIALAKSEVSETASMTCNGSPVNYGDAHFEPISYFFHSSWGPAQTGCRYVLDVTFVFEVPDGTLTVNLSAPWLISYA